MTKSDLLFDVASGVAVVTLNRPDAMNALTLLMIHALTEQLRDWAKDDSISAVVVGAGRGGRFARVAIFAPFMTHVKKLGG